jgi:amino acid adenylation domain-containing protein
MEASEKITLIDREPRSLPEPLSGWAGGLSEYPRQKTVAQIFEEVAASHRDRTALIFGDLRVTYEELNRRGNDLAHTLKRLGVNENSLVGLCLDRSPDMIVAVLAILKAGAAYVPIDCEYPQKRIDFILRDTQVQVLVTRRALASGFSTGGSLKLLLMDNVIEELSLRANTNPEPLTGPDSLAYIMYTSGSTGRPKGVLVENRSIVRLVCNTNFCKFGPEEVFLQLAPISFDASTFEIWGSLLHGATLVIAPPGALSLAQIGQAIRDSQVTTVWLTAGLFHLFVDERLEDLRPLKQLLAGGDVLYAAYVRRVLEKFPELVLINGYGPTEGTTFTCCHVMRHGEAIPDSVPIGRPISNTFAYILDEKLNPVVGGEEGELFAGGDGIARGYLNAPELTEERFLADPFRGGHPARMYRTGDRVRWREDATIEFLGRVDMQVKILGYRVELGEIEAALLCHSAIRQACVVAKKDEAGNKRLVAHYVTSESNQLSARELKQFLALTLPTFMIPAVYTPLAALPLNLNGKLDRAALSEAAPTLSQASKQEVSSDLEQLVTDVWKQVLRQDCVGLDDNFFDLGGDSLLIVAVHSQLQKLLNREIRVTDLFGYTTIRTFSQHFGKTAPVPSFSAVQQQAQKQRAAFARRQTSKGKTT